jgi:Cdc6-like AAA superfamily ATPase
LPDAAAARPAAAISPAAAASPTARAPASAELPETGERFEGLIPPIVAAPALAIRKPAVAIFTLADYARAGIMTAEQAELLCDAVSQHRNILIAGGTSTGKTTLVNSLLAEVAWTADRVVLVEDTRELQCNAPNLVALRTRDGVASLCDLVRPFWPSRSGQSISMLCNMIAISCSRRRMRCSKRVSSGGPTRASSVAISCRNRATAMRAIHGKSR